MRYLRLLEKLTIMTFQDSEVYVIFLVLTGWSEKMLSDLCYSSSSLKKKKKVLH